MAGETLYGAQVVHAYCMVMRSQRPCLTLQGMVLFSWRTTLLWSR